MPRKLKVYQTSQGFYDLAVAAPSMKAALEAWGAGSNLFHQGFAKESDDSKATSGSDGQSPASSSSVPWDLTPLSVSTQICRQPCRSMRTPAQVQSQGGIKGR